MVHLMFRKRLLSLAISTLLVAACDGGGSYSSSSTAPEDPTTPSTGDTSTSTTEGRITGFGSVIINGVHFDVDSANILHDGVPITEQDLKVGMIIRLSGSVDADGANGTATEIEFDEELRGPVSSIDLTASSFVVLGQSVMVDEDTVFDGTTLDGLALGNLVEISGYFDADGILRASLVELDKIAPDLDEEFELKGVVRLHDAANKQFVLGDLTVDYSSAELSDFVEGVISDGMLVEVKANAEVSGGVLVASEVEYEKTGHGAGNAGEEKTLEGLVTAMNSATEFTVNGYTVLLSESTEFEDGSADSIYLNTKIKVQGQFNADGALVAEEVKLRRRGDTRLEALVQSVDAEAGVLTVLDTQVRVTPSTVWEDESAEDDQFINLSSLLSGDRVKIRGYIDAQGVLVATAIERKDADEEDAFELEGTVADLVLNTSFSVLGVTVRFGVDTEFEHGDEVTLEQFFAGLAEGDKVKVEGTLVSASELTAATVELEENDERDEFGGDPSRGRPDVEEESEGGELEGNDQEIDESEGTDSSVGAPSELEEGSDDI